MTETGDNDSELPPEEFGDGSATLGPGDDTVNANLDGPHSDGRPLSGTIGPGDITINTDLAELAGESTGAIRQLKGRFVLDSKLGQGGMGEVFSARDSTLNREVAVKVLSGKKSVGLARFVREAQVTAQLSHCLLYTSPSPRDRG